MTKTDFCSGVQCAKQLWLLQNEPEKLMESLDPLKARNGREVGAAARDLFKCNAIVRLDDPEVMVSETEYFMSHNAKVIAEASFMTKDGFCSVDILKNLGDKNVEIYEVKSSKEIKDINYYDVAYQYRILTDAGFNVVKACLVTINGEYVRHGELNLEGLFLITDVTEKVISLQPEIRELLQSFENMSEPDKEIGEWCFKPYACEFFEYCTENLPHPNVFDIAGMQSRTKLKHLHNNEISFNDLESAELKDNYLLQVQHEIRDIPPHIDVNGLKEFLSRVKYPLYFLDFETVNPAIPMFDNSAPYQQIPFQYSLHYKVNESSQLRHDEYIAMPGVDPRKEIAERLCMIIPNDGTVIVYNKSFEPPRLKEMADLCPELKDKLYTICDNVVDLMEPFKNKMYYTKAMKGSYSIKLVLPAIFPDDPELNYNNLDGVHHGTEASEAFYLMDNATPEKLEEYRRQLFRYCGLDTYATVKLLNFLQNLVE